jgi:hypothetical protein
MNFDIKPIKAFFRKHITQYIISDTPQMTMECADELTKLIEKSTVYLEYGSGGSTILAVGSELTSITTVESDKIFLSNVVNKVKGMVSTAKFNPIYVNIGITGAYGYPLFGFYKRKIAYGGVSLLSSKSRWGRYAIAPWIQVEQEPDLILIDGRFRVASVLQSLIKLSENNKCTLMLDDYRDHYKVIEPFIDIKKLVDNRSLIFTKKRENFDELKCQKLLDKYNMDPR